MRHGQLSDHSCLPQIVSTEQMIRRTGARAAQRHRRAGAGSYPGEGQGERQSLLLDEEVEPIDEELGLMPGQDEEEGDSQGPPQMSSAGSPPTQTILIQQDSGAPRSNSNPQIHEHHHRHRSKSKQRHQSATGETASSWQRSIRAAQAATALAQGADRTIPQTHLPGQVQGIDLSRSPEQLAWLSSTYQAECSISVVDFSSDQVLMRSGMTNAALPGFLAERRPAWSRVRWLNVDRLSWDVIHPLALHYKIHPLAVEDVLHVPQRIKADFYEHFLYVSLTLITLAVKECGGSKDTSTRPAPIPPTSRTPSNLQQQQQQQQPPPPKQPPTSPPNEPQALQTALSTTASTTNQPDQHTSPFHPHEGEGEDQLGPLDHHHDSDVPSDEDVLASLPARRLGRTTSLSRPMLPLRPARRSGASSPGSMRGTFAASPQGAARLALEMLPAPPGSGGSEAGGGSCSNKQGIPVHRQQVSIWVADNNTIISIFEASGQAVTKPLLQQLREPHTLARDAGDASYLLCLLLDALADSVYPVVDAYSSLVEGYEGRILGGRPEAESTRELHLIQGDLATLRRTVLPTLHLVAALRSHARETAREEARSALVSGATSPVGMPSRAMQPAAMRSSRPQLPQLHEQMQVEFAFGPQPLVSNLTKTYLGDVQDHLTTVLDTLDSQIEACRDLIDLAFNLIAHGTNQAMQALTVVSVLFLPLTFLAGIYGMNFDKLPELHWDYGYLYFWGMCGLICVVFIWTMYRRGMMGGNRSAGH